MNAQPLLPLWRTVASLQGPTGASDTLNRPEPLGLAIVLRSLEPQRKTNGETLRGFGLIA